MKFEIIDLTDASAIVSLVRLGRFSKILVAIDGSDKSIEAAEQGIIMAKKDKAELVVVNIIHTPASTLLYSTEKSFKDFIKKSRAEANTWFGRIRKKADEYGVGLKTEIIEELYSVPSAIVNYAEAMEADLIVIGGTGRTGFKKLLLGTVSGEVVRYSRCPVLVVK